MTNLTPECDVSYSNVEAVPPILHQKIQIIFHRSWLWAQGDKNKKLNAPRQPHKTSIMKILFLKPAFLFLLAVVSAGALAGCGKDDEFTRRSILAVDDTNGYTNVNLQDCQYNLDNLPLENLGEAEKNSILFMREEEKLAKDMYLKLYEKWSHNAFQNISESEQTHMETMLQLLEKYNLEDPVGANGIGVFTNDSLQALYNTLLPLGETSLVEALKVGALIEEVDILDLKNPLDNFVDNEDIEMVYENLMKASRNHLRAFVKNLKNQGVTYVPQRLTQADFDAIVNSSWEHGNGG